MRKTGTLVSLLIVGSLLCACSDSSSNKDGSTDRDSAARDAGPGEAGDGEVGQGEVGESEVGAGEVGGGEVGEGDAGDQAAVLSIASGLLFSTPNLVVPAGITITVENQDSVPHTVTSQLAPNTFQPSGTFDTGVINGGGSATIAIPAGAVPGSIYYFYCAIHTSLMVPPNGTITIR